MYVYCIYVSVYIYICICTQSNTWCGSCELVSLPGCDALSGGAVATLLELANRGETANKIFCAQQLQHSVALSDESPWNKSTPEQFFTAHNRRIRASSSNSFNAGPTQRWGLINITWLLLRPTAHVATLAQSTGGISGQQGLIGLTIQYLLQVVLSEIAKITWSLV